MSTQDKLFGKKIVIIGGSSGIGFGLAKSVLALGAHVYISSSSSEKVQKAVDRLVATSSPGKCFIQGIKLGGLDATHFEALFKEVGSFDHLVYTAGDPLAIVPILTTPVDELKKALNVRLWGAVAAVQAAHPLLNPHGSITLTGGTAPYRPPTNWSVIVAGSGALQSLVRGLAVDLAPVRVNLVEPGATRTELWDQLVGGLPGEAQEKVFAQQAENSLVKKMGEAEDIAEAYIYFMKADFVTGTNTIIDGGALLL
ncbi:hypothetical protein PLICRDRAFT_42922 [Plicaturopsis crispa FD-325 SS-3]|nr:hypothetical protein PLICRDRAFT_42922 [Plicaturopsis crispa FD-325 SS-3]